MRLEELQPNLSLELQDRQKLDDALGLLDMVTKANISNGDSKYRGPSIGLDQIVNTWIRQQIQFRSQLLNDLYTIAMSIGEIRGPINHITGEVFRRGIAWKARFTLKCTTCGTEYQEEVEECRVCVKNEDIFDLVEPDEQQKKLFASYLKDANIWDQAFEDMMKQFHFDLNALDDAYIFLEKEYYAPNENPDEPVVSKIVGVRHLHPALVEFDIDQNGLPKNSHFFCYIHRDEGPFSESGECEFCGRQMVAAMYRYMNRGQSLYMLDSEIIHASKFNPSETYGWSPILTIFEKALTIIGMDKNVYRYFYERQMPASMIMVFTDDPENLRRERDDISSRTRLDPNYVPMVAVSSRTNRGRVDMVRLFHTLQEMEYLPVREEIRERIASMWGVTPAWQGSPEAFGGLSTQTQQLVVMSRVVEADQRIFHEKVFPVILESFGVMDWTLELPVPEEKAEATRIQFAQQRTAIAQQLLGMGFQVSIKSQEGGIDNIDFTVSGEAQDPNAPPPGMEGELPPGEEDMPLQMALDTYPTWFSDLVDLGYDSPIVKMMAGNKLLFTDGDRDYVGTLTSKGRVVSAQAAKYTKIPKIKLPGSRYEKRVEGEVYNPEEPEEPEEL